MSDQYKIHKSMIL